MPQSDFVILKQMKYTAPLQSKNGKTISILVFESSKNPILTIIESQGGFKGKKEDVAQENKPLVDYCTKNNMNYIAVDLSNNGTQENQPFDELLFSNRVKDIETVVDFYYDKYKSPIILLGSSLGGLITLNAAKHNSQVKGIVLNCAAVKAHISLENTNDPSEIKHWKEKGVATIWGVPLPYSFYEDLVNLDATKVLPSLKMPILWFHGTADTVVPFKQAEEAKLLNPNIELVAVQSGAHRFGDKMLSGEWERKVEEFINKIKTS